MKENMMKNSKLINFLKNLKTENKNHHLIVRNFEAPAGRSKIVERFERQLKLRTDNYETWSLYEIKVTYHHEHNSLCL